MVHVRARCLTYIFFKVSEKKIITVISQIFFFRFLEKGSEKFLEDLTGWFFLKVSLEVGQTHNSRLFFRNFEQIIFLGITVS